MATAKSRKMARKGTKKAKAAIAKASKRARPKRGVRGSQNATNGMVGLAPRATNQMRPMRTKSSNDGHMCRFRGTDFVTAITIGGTAAAAGDVLYTTVVNPKTLGVSRLATVSALWERYKFRRCTFRYSPIANATQTGQVIGYVDYDTYDDPTGISGVQNLQRAAAHFGEKPSQIWQPVNWAIKDVDPMTDLYVESDGTDPRWTNQGRLVVLAASAIASATSCGNIYMDYDVEFYIPQLEETPNNGFGYAVAGGGTMNTSAILGSTPAVSTWSNLPVSISGNVISLKPGSYLLTAALNGTGITDNTWTTTGTTVLSKKGLVSTTDSTTWIQVYSAANFTVTMTATATTIAASNLKIALLPSTALTVTQRKLNQISRMLQLVGDVESMRKTLAAQVDKECVPESKECKLVVSGETASMSALASGCMGATIAKNPLVVDDGYMLVKRGSRSV